MFFRVCLCLRKIHEKRKYIKELTIEIRIPTTPAKGKRTTPAYTNSSNVKYFPSRWLRIRQYTKNAPKTNKEMPIPNDKEAYSLRNLFIEEKLPYQLPVLAGDPAGFGGLILNLVPAIEGALVGEAFSHVYLFYLFAGR